MAPISFRYLRVALPDRPFFYYRKDQLAAVRLGRFKLHFFTQNSYGQPNPVHHTPPLLFNLARDPGESFNLAAEHPQVIADINAAIATHREKLVIGPPQF